MLVRVPAAQVDRTYRVLARVVQNALLVLPQLLQAHRCVQRAHQELTHLTLQLRAA